MVHLADIAWPQIRRLDPRCGWEEDVMNRKLYVGNLAFATEEATLEGLFAEAGPVQSVRVMRDKETGRSRGFAFVEMGRGRARAAIEKFNEAEIEGRRLAVNEARPQPTGGGRGLARRFGSRIGGGGGGNRRREPLVVSR
jgi:RNA recognition motif-containing protein